MIGTGAFHHLTSRTNDVRKEQGVNTKVLELIKAQTDISLSEIAVRLDTELPELLQPYKYENINKNDLEKAYKAGKMKTIGLFNFITEQIQEMLSVYKVKSAIYFYKIYYAI